MGDEKMIALRSRLVFMIGLILWINVGYALFFLIQEWNVYRMLGLIAGPFVMGYVVSEAVVGNWGRRRAEWKSK